MLDAASAVPEDLTAHVIRVIANTQRVGVDTISIDDTFENLKIDSLDGINIVFALESEFHISVPDDAIRDMRAIRDVVDGVAKLVLEKQARLNSVEAGSEASPDASNTQANSTA
jgi:acyl carrier protein